MEIADTLPQLLMLAWLLPLVSFALIALFGPRMGPAGKYAGYVATGAIIGSFILSVIALATWTGEHGVFVSHEAGQHATTPQNYNGDWYALGLFGDLKISIGYYIDSLTIVMFTMVTLIASCIHFYAQGYMHDELHDITDHEVTLENGEHLKRKGRYHRFFQFLSLFCFSMLGIVIAGNIAMVFVFWELVGICSYFLIGFYIERKSASTAANKAFIVNRVGDFGMLIGMMALWSSLGTFNFGDEQDKGKLVENGKQGIFSLVRSEENHHQLKTPQGMIAEANMRNPEATDEEKSSSGYWLLVVAGIGIFCGCVGKSAQFPLHVWLPDAMEGPTPVSALVHSATMVAAGVYLTGRFYPVFAPEVLLIIAIVGCITLFMAATIAITATDIKRVLAYSTVSQLGYMMFALGVGGWLAGMLHLITHAFFKSLLFLCSGSVIHAVHSNELTEMGGLRKKMPWTAYTMLIGCLAIIGAGIPFVIGFSGYYSKDAIIEQALLFKNHNSLWFGGMFFVAVGGAAITAFYMFRLWFMTFAGEPRNKERYDHAHESPKIMYVPLVVLAVFAAVVVWPSISYSPLVNLLEQSVPAGVAAGFTNSKETEQQDHSPEEKHHTQQANQQTVQLTSSATSTNENSVNKISSGNLVSDHAKSHDDHQGHEKGHDQAHHNDHLEERLIEGLTIPPEHDSHEDEIKIPATWYAFSTAMGGLFLAICFYGMKYVNPSEVRQQFPQIHRFLLNKWWFDELYEYLFIKPVMMISSFISWIDKNIIDRFVDGCAKGVRYLAQIDDLIDRFGIDWLVNAIGNTVHSVGLSLRAVQTGSIRQYVLFVVVGTVALFVIISFVVAGVN